MIFFGSIGNRITKLIKGCVILNLNIRRISWSMKNWFSKLFAKKEENNDSQPTRKYKETKEAIHYIPFFDEEKSIYYPVDEEENISVLLTTLSEVLEKNKVSLYEASIKNAVGFIEYTGESFSVMFDEEDVPEEAEDFMEQWNSGDNEFVSFIDRWFTKEESIEIAKDVRSTQSNFSSLSELQMQTAKSVLKLGYTKGNFGNVHLAIKEELKSNPCLIADYMRLCSINISKVENHIQWIISFDCDWELEHGVDWVIKDDQPVFVGSDGLSISDKEFLEWNELHVDDPNDMFN